MGSGEERNIDDVAEAVLNVLGLPPTLKTYVPDRPGHDRRYLLDSTKIGSELGWEPEVTFDAGIRKAIDWYRAHPDWWRPKVAGALVAERGANKS